MNCAPLKYTTHVLIALQFMHVDQKKFLLSLNSFWNELPHCINSASSLISLFHCYEFATNQPLNFGCLGRFLFR